MDSTNIKNVTYIRYGKTLTAELKTRYRKLLWSWSIFNKTKEEVDDIIDNHFTGLYKTYRHLNKKVFK